ncbi:hypothetical protein [Mycolicibacterium mageritense]|uniref:Uncharacterized protein n=1 Tax=Mycolicibacterium mageritense TaxID=53462 RepID=A0AAI8U2A4_MYCME|nr:hypothetical protein [Mycolicibacterium mageritense]BDY33211.1 hypothetical protein hbim_07186 [Mycolicibacterium mageritense]
MTDKAIVDSLTLRFVGENEDGVALHELRAAHVAEVLQGLVGLASDFDNAGVFHDEGPSGSEVLVRPAKDGSFLIEVVRVVTENWDTAKIVGAAAGAVTGIPSLGSIVWWATKSQRADVKDFNYLANGNVKVTWQDDTAQEVPVAVWKELQKHKRRRKKQLRQIMAPLADSRVTELDVATSADTDHPAPQDKAPQTFVLKRADYDAVRPEDEIKETSETFEVEAQMSAIDFDDPARWRVKTKDRTRTVTVEDEKFLGRVARGLAIHPKDIFSLRIREDATVKNGQTRTKWAVVQVTMVRRAARGDESQEHVPSST